MSDTSLPLGDLNVCVEALLKKNKSDTIENSFD